MKRNEMVVLRTLDFRVLDRPRWLLYPVRVTIAFYVDLEFLIRFHVRSKVMFICYLIFFYNLIDFHHHDMLHVERNKVCIRK